MTARKILEENGYASSKKKDKKEKRWIVTRLIGLLSLLKWMFLNIISINSSCTAQMNMTGLEKLKRQLTSNMFHETFRVFLQKSSGHLLVTLL